MDVSFSKFAFLLENSSFITGNKYHPLFFLMWQSRFLLLRRYLPHAQLRTTAVCVPAALSHQTGLHEKIGPLSPPLSHTARAVRGLPMNAERRLTASPAQSWHTGIFSYCVSPVVENSVPDGTGGAEMTELYPLLCLSTQCTRQRTSQRDYDTALDLKALSMVLGTPRGPRMTL